MVDDFQVWLEPGLGDFLRIDLQVIDTGDVVEHLKLQPRVVAEERTDRDELRRIDRDERVERLGTLRGDRGAELRFE